MLHPTTSDTRWHKPGVDSPAISRVSTGGRRLSAAGAFLIVVGGYVHLCLYRSGYRFIPKIGISFLMQAIASLLLAAALLAPRLYAARLGQLTRAAGIALSVSTLGALALAHTSKGLFQFREIGLSPAPQTLIAIAVESLATVLLASAILEHAAVLRRQQARAVVVPVTRSHARDAA